MITSNLSVKEGKLLKLVYNFSNLIPVAGPTLVNNLQEDMLDLS